VEKLSAVQITALQTATGLHRETLTSSTGTYDIPELPVGVYRVTYSEPGFREKVIEGLEQTVGHTRTLNLDLAVGGHPSAEHGASKGHPGALAAFEDIV
jgi:hypothetical protein